MTGATGESDGEGGGEGVGEGEGEGEGGGSEKEKEDWSSQLQTCWSMQVEGAAASSPT